MPRHLPIVCLIALLWLPLGACTQHKVEVAPVEIKPIHITIDVNIRMQKALDDFFGDIDSAAETLDKTATDPAAPKTGQ